MVRGEDEVHEAEVRLQAGPLHEETELGFAVLNALSSTGLFLRHCSPRRAIWQKCRHAKVAI